MTRDELVAKVADGSFIYGPCAESMIDVLIKLDVLKVDPKPHRNPHRVVNIMTEYGTDTKVSVVSIAFALKEAGYHFSISHDGLQAGRWEA
jgi:hypothetical protein